MIQKLHHLALELHISLQELEYLLHYCEDYYYRKLEIKLNSDGTPRLGRNGEAIYREIFPSYGRLKKIQRRVNRIFRRIEYDPCLFGGVPGRDNIQNALFHRGSRYFFCTDIKDFFPSISHHRVYASLRALEFSPEVAGALTRLSTLQGFLPQGAPSSSFLANIAFFEGDALIRNIALTVGAIYSRYIDDITLSSKYRLPQAAIDNVLDVIRDQGFHPAYNKTYSKVGPTEITGVVARNNVVTLTLDMKQRIADDPTNEGRLLYKARIRDASYGMRG